MHRTSFLFATTGVAALALFLGACGDSDGGTASGGSKAAKAVEIKMIDTAYEPDEIEVAKGQEVRLVFVNDGKLRHEAYVGDPDEQKDHEEKMSAGAGSGDHNMGGGNPKVTVEPGKEGDLTYRFEEAGTFEIGCHEPGHYDAGMKITVVVT